MGQLDFESVDDLSGDSLLNIEHVVERPTELSRPDVCITTGVNELGRDPQTIAGLPDRSLQGVLNTYLARNGLDRLASTLVDWIDLRAPLNIIVEVRDTTCSSLT